MTVTLDGVTPQLESTAGHDGASVNVDDPVPPLVVFVTVKVYEPATPTVAFVEPPSGVTETVTGGGCTLYTIDPLSLAPEPDAVSVTAPLPGEVPPAKETPTDDDAPAFSEIALGCE